MLYTQINNFQVRLDVAVLRHLLCVVHVNIFVLTTSIERICLKSADAVYSWTYVYLHTRF